MTRFFAKWETKQSFNVLSRMNLSFPESLRKKIEEYYYSYYWLELGHKNWKRMAEDRLKEDELIGTRAVEWVREWIPTPIQGAKTLIVGGGTGAETVAFTKANAQVTVLEPHQGACEIILEKLAVYGLKNVQVDCGVGEKMSYANGEFDLMICITVLEHTQDPMACLDEMIRVLKPKGWLFLMTPEYSSLYEQHYKRDLPLFLPKWLIKVWLRVLKRPADFIDTLQFVNYKMLRDKFSMLPVNAFYRHYPWPEEWVNGINKMGRKCYRYGKIFKIQRDQFWLVQKI